MTSLSRQINVSEMSCGGHVEFVFHYRITEFMRLIVDDLDLMESDSVKAVADWMMKKIR